VGRPAPDVTGTDLGGIALHIPVGVADGGARWTLLLFVKTDCLGCETLWPLVAMGSLDAGAPVAVVGAVAEVGPEERAHVASLCGGGTVAVGRGSWDAYKVRGPSFAVLVNGATGLVHWESVAWDGAQVVADTISQVRADPTDHQARPYPGGHGGQHP